MKSNIVKRRFETKKFRNRNVTLWSKGLNLHEEVGQHCSQGHSKTYIERRCILFLVFALLSPVFCVMVISRPIFSCSPTASSDPNPK